MKSYLLTIALLTPVLAQASLSTESYRCAPTKAQAAPTDLAAVEIRKDAKDQIMADVSLKEGVATVTYSTEVKYSENPKFTFPEWDGDGLSFIIEKKAKDFKADSFMGTVSGTTPDSTFTASVECKLKKSVSGAKILVKK